MSDIPVITISCSNDLRTSGDIIAGVIDLNLALAQEKDVTSVTVSLRGEINTQVTVTQGGANNQSTTTHRHRIRLFTQKQTIWAPGYAVPSHSSGVASFPFSFTMPTTDLPPSFHGGTSRTGGSVQYYLHGVAERKSWYKRNTRVNQAFPFLPVDRTPAPLFLLPNWPGEWEIISASKKMRRGIISHYGLAVVELHIPKISVIPLFRPIPIRLRIVCTSKPLPRSASEQLDKFEFPRNPKVSDVDLSLRQSCTVVVGIHHRRCTDHLGLQAGFGLPDQVDLRATWGNQVQTSVTPPHWIVDESDNNKGCWSEEVMFSSTLILRCPPPFNSPSLASSVFLDLHVVFPGLSNKVKTEIGPLQLTSGIAPLGGRGYLGASSTSEEEAMPPYSETPRYMDLPPNYYEVVQMDEKDGGSNDD